MCAGKLMVCFRVKVLGQSQEFPQDLISSYFMFVSDEEMSMDMDQVNCSRWLTGSV